MVSADRDSPICISGVEHLQIGHPIQPNRMARNIQQMGGHVFMQTVWPSHRPHLISISTQHEAIMASGVPSLCPLCPPGHVAKRSRFHTRSTGIGSALVARAKPCWHSPPTLTLSAPALSVTSLSRARYAFQPGLLPGFFCGSPRETCPTKLCASLWINGLTTRQSRAGCGFATGASILGSGADCGLSFCKVW